MAGRQRRPKRKGIAILVHPKSRRNSAAKTSISTDGIKCAECFSQPYLYCGLKKEFKYSINNGKMAILAPNPKFMITYGTS